MTIKTPTMTTTSYPSTSSHLLLGNRAIVFVLVAATFLAAFSVRVYINVNGPPEFQYVRQFHSALLTRSFLYSDREDIPQWQQEIVKRTTPPWHEPPISEWLMAKIFQHTGEQSFLIPRLFTSMVWLLGGVFLFLLLERYFDPETSLIATSLYLFLPFSIEMSLSFQPDSLMLMLTIASILSIASYRHAPNTGHWWIMTGTIALALFVKPFAIFMIFTTYISLSLVQIRFRELITDKTSWLLAVVAMLPISVYYVYQLLNQQLLQTLSEKMILKDPLTSIDFYINWLYRIESVIGFPLLVLAMLGTLAFKTKETRYLAIGLWAGYIIFGLIFTFMYATHTYYHIAIIPIAAFCISPLISRFLDMLRGQARFLVTPALIGILCFLAALNIKPLISSAKAYDNEKMPSIYREIGEIVGHSPRTVALSEHEAEPLQYYGWIVAANWPGGFHVKAEQYGFDALLKFDIPGAGATSTVTAKERFTRDFAPDNPEFFIITNMKEYVLQPNLDQFLRQNYCLIAETKQYLVFDLRPNCGKHSQATRPSSP